MGATSLLLLSNLNIFIMHKKHFTETEIGILRVLFQKKETANRSEQKNIRARMRSLGFYITDYDNNMDLSGFERLVNSWKENLSNDTEGKNANGVCSKEENNLFHNGLSEAPAAKYKKGLAPWVGEDPRVLILGTFPGEKSLKNQAYYQDRSHNSFYKIMETLFDRKKGISDKDFLIENHIALWDCMGIAEREGSIDANITDYTPNEIKTFLDLYPSITTIVLNGTGKTTEVFYKKFNVAELKKHFEIKSLPSTANTNSIPFESKLREWEFIKDIVNN